MILNRKKAEFEPISAVLNMPMLTGKEPIETNDISKAEGFFKTNIKYYEDLAKAKNDNKVMSYERDAILETNNRLANGEDVGSSELFNE